MKIKRCLYEWKCAKPFSVYQKASKRASTVLEMKNKLPHRWNQDETITLPVKHVEAISRLPVDVSQWLMMMWPLLQPAHWIVWCCLISALIQPHDENLITVEMDNEPKYTTKATQEFLKAKKLYSSVIDWKLLSSNYQNPPYFKWSYITSLIEPLKKYKCIKMAFIFKHLMQKFC